MKYPNRIRTIAVGFLTAFLLLGVSGFALGLLLPTETKVTELAPGVYFRKAQWKPNFIGCNQGWVIFDDFVLVIEASFPNQAEELIKEIRKTTDKPIKFVFDTHYHGDHADGNPVFISDGASVIAAESSREQFLNKGLAAFENSKQKKPSEYGHLKYGIPSVYFPKKMVLEDSSQRVELIHFGHGHTPGDAVAWLPKHGILFTGDCCVNGAFNNTADSDTASWISILTEMAKLPVKIVCPGHGEMSDVKLIETQRRYFIDLRDAIHEGIRMGKTLDEIKATIDLPWYQEWADVSVRERGENIEHIFKELKTKN